MAYRNNPTYLKRDYGKTGFTSPSDVYDIIKDNVEELSEFYEFEPAEVKEVLISAKQLPKIKGPENAKVPDYSYMGSIKAVFIYSQSSGDEIEGIIKPLSSHIVCYPLKGEVVNVVKHGGQYYYYNPLNLYGRVNVNRVGGRFGEGLVSQKSTILNRPLVPRQGDLVLNGRFGQGLRFGSDGKEYRYPTIKITNNQSTKVQKLGDINFPHRQNVNADGSSINITSGPFNNDPLETATVSNIYPSPSALPQYQGKMDGDMITINSDKLVFNAKGIPSENVNNGDIHMFAVRNINLNCNQSITLEVGEDGVINLGEYKAINPVVKGIQTEELFKKLFKILSDFTKVASSVSGFKDLNDAATNLSEKLATLENNNLPRIFSNTVFITEDG